MKRTKAEKRTCSNSQHPSLQAQTLIVILRRDHYNQQQTSSFCTCLHPHTRYDRKRVQAKTKKVQAVAYDFIEPNRQEESGYFIEPNRQEESGYFIEPNRQEESGYFIEPNRQEESGYFIEPNRQEESGYFIEPNRQEKSGYFIEPNRQEESGY